MKKRLLALLAAFLLLFPLAACKKDATLPGGDAGFPPADDGGTTPGNNNGNTNAFYEEHGYTEDFTLRFSSGEDSLDTAKGEITYEGVLYGFDFTPELASFYNSLLERNFQNLPADMTLKALTGEEAPEGTRVYTFTVTDLGKTYTVTTDEAALKRPSTPNLSNLTSLIREFSGLLAARAASATPKG